MCVCICVYNVKKKKKKQCFETTRIYKLEYRISKLKQTKTIIFTYMSRYSVVIPSFDCSISLLYLEKKIERQEKRNRKTKELNMKVSDTVYSVHT